MNQINIAIMGYGNIGRSAAKLIENISDMTLTHIFSRRIIEHPNYCPVEEATNHQDEIDVLLLCGGSKSDIPTQGPFYARCFSTVDSYDNHHLLPKYLTSLNESALRGRNCCLSAAGWDPGLFSITRTLFDSILPKGITHTFWGKGVSQGHSQALRTLDEVIDAVQYTVPIENTLERIRKGQQITLDASQKHHRLCYVVPKEGCDLNRLQEKIRTMPDYFADYYTTVQFITMEEMNRNHRSLHHGGMVLHNGTTGENQHRMELSLTLDSNPDFTASILLAYARACYALKQEGKNGAFTPLDIPPILLLTEEQKKDLTQYL